MSKCLLHLYLSCDPYSTSCDWVPPDHLISISHKLQFFLFIYVFWLFHMPRNILCFQSTLSVKFPLTPILYSACGKTSFLVDTWTTLLLLSLGQCYKDGVFRILDNYIHKFGRSFRVILVILVQVGSSICTYICMYQDTLIFSLCWLLFILELQCLKETLILTI